MKEQLSKIWKMIREFLKKYHLVKWTVFVSLFLAVVFSAYLLFLAKTTDVAALKTSMEQQTVIYDANGEQAGALQNQKGTYVSLDNISDNIKNAVISTEDKRFYEHHGVDYLGIARNLVNFFLKGFKVTGGGSTLTQQLAKNAYLNQQQTLIRKAQELFLAKEIERVYSKDDILTMYLNHAYFGYGVWGVEDASQRYFGKSAKDVSVSEAAVLAGMLKGPSLYNPIDNPENAINRRDTVLQLMLDNKVISQDQYQAALNSTITLSNTYESTSKYKYPYYFDEVIAEAISKYHISEEDLFTKGYRVYTTLNQSYQKVLDSVYADEDYFPVASDGTSAQSASIVSDVKTGGVLALVGGLGEHVYRGFNRATQMYRQPGSTIKPLVVYTPAVEKGYTPNSIVLDQVKAYGSDAYTPQNWNKESVGSLPMYQALIQSKNTSAVWLLDQIGLQTGLDKLHAFGIQTEPEDDNLSIALGGMTKGTTLMAMNNAYAAFANEGTLHQPYFITKIIDASGNTIVDKTYSDSKRIMSKETATTMTKMMLGTYETGGLSPMNLSYGLKMAGKTGTTDMGDVNIKDMWSIGYTPDFVVTSWIGYDNDDHYLSWNRGDSIKPLFQALAKQLVLVSPQTEFTVTSSTQDDASNQKQSSSSSNSDSNDGESLGEKVKETIQNTWNGISNFFGNLFNGGNR